MQGVLKQAPDAVLVGGRELCARQDPFVKFLSPLEQLVGSKRGVPLRLVVLIGSDFLAVLLYVGPKKARHRT